MPNVETELNLYKPLKREHPLDNILRNAGPFHVESSLSVLEFFKVMVRLIECLMVVQFNDSDLYNMLASVSVRSLRACVITAKQQAWPVVRFHTYVLQKFVPPLVYQ